MEQYIKAIRELKKEMNTKEKAIQALKDFGLLTKTGRLSKRYYENQTLDI